MIRLLIDTNIILDLLAKREPFFNNAASLFSYADKNKIELAISSLTIANISYVLSKQKTSQQAREILRKFRVLVQVLPLDDKIIDLALSDSTFNDYEDGLQYYTAIGNDIHAIITRDLKDFKNSKIPVMTADEYLTSVNKKT